MVWLRRLLSTRGVSSFGKLVKLIETNTAAQHFKIQKSEFHSTSCIRGLMEFFDDKKNWEKIDGVAVGRSWEKPELRTRSNEELHKLWYVLLKEMNMLLTMKAEYDRLCEVMPSPERLEKVELSMDNLRDVVDERNKALAMLETGEPAHPRWITDKDELGRTIRRLEEEHLVPKEHNTEFLLVKRF